MVEGPRAALEFVLALERSGELDDDRLLHAARADFSRRLGDLLRAVRSLVRALELVGNDSERRFLERRLLEVRELRAGSSS
jgi:RNA polymerase sigma-70 factor (ECF subfamily)